MGTHRGPYPHKQHIIIVNIPCFFELGVQLKYNLLYSADGDYFLCIDHPSAVKVGESTSFMIKIVDNR